MEDFGDVSFEDREIRVYDYIPKLIGGALSGALTGIFALGIFLHFFESYWAFSLFSLLITYVGEENSRGWGFPG